MLERGELVYKEATYGVHMSLAPRIVGLLALAALLPAAAFIVFKSEFIVAVSLVNVLLITGSLFIAMSPTEEHAHPNGA
jgi:hypothetical protein